MKFEIYYHDPSVPGPTFVVVVNSPTSDLAKKRMVNYGYLPLRVRKLGGNDGLRG